MIMQSVEETAWDDRTVDQPAYVTLIVVMTWGFRLSFAVLLAGLAVALARDEPLSKRVEPIGDVASGLRHLRAWALVDLSLLLLMLTPAASVVVILLHFLRYRDWLYSIGAAIVVGTLGIGIILAFD
jgi:uncharacterized membrane protein